MEKEVVMEIGEEAKPKSCSSEIESDKQHELAEKTLKDDGGVQENGVRVSENGEKKSDDDEKTKGNISESGKTLTESEVIEDCMMNGVSSLLKLKENLLEEKKGTDEEEDGEEEEEEEEEEKHGYCVGDFVWGKIKNHPWWPGQIYDPSDASDVALKIKQKGKLLVGYFGDGTFAWCGASQLKPFAESFKEHSKMSNSKSFLSAVEESVEEMGKHIERLLICDCAKEKDEFGSREANNAGIKEGVMVPDVKREVISLLLLGKCGEVLKDVKSFAETVSFSDLLDLEILKRKISAFYRSKRGYGLIEYHESVLVPGLEDKNNDDEDEEQNVNDGLEWRAKRSRIDEAAALDPNESLVKCSSGFPDRRLLHRRKEKSIAELLKNESAAKVRFEIEPADGDVKSGRRKTKSHDEVNGELEITTVRRKGKKSDVYAIEDAGGHELVGESSKGKTSRNRKKRDVDDGGSEGREETGKKEVSNMEIDVVRRRGKKSDVSTIEDAGGHELMGESSKGKTSRNRKKRDVDDVGSEGREETGKKEMSNMEIDIDSTPLASLQKRVRVDDASSVEKSAQNGETATQTKKRERKLSKYFSPDYLSDFPRKVRKVTKIESESSKVSSKSQVGEHVTDASESLVAMEEDKLDKPCEPPSLEIGLVREEQSEELSNAVEFLRLGATSKEMQDLIRVAALGTQYPDDSGLRDMVREFMTIYRSFTYHEGANHKFFGSYNNSSEELNETVKPETKGKEKKDKEHKDEQLGKEIEETVNEDNATEKHGRMKKEGKRKKSESKKRADGEKETRKEPSESTKEKKKLNEAEHGEEETRNETEKPKKKKKGREGKSNEKTEAAEVAETTMEVEYLKKKLEEMRMLLDECEGGMTEEVKVKLEGEIVNLLEKVREMRSSSSA